MVHTSQCREAARVDSVLDCTEDCTEYRKGLEGLLTRVRKSIGYETANEVEKTLEDATQR